MEHDNLEDILCRRKFEPASDDLAGRIIMMTSRMPQEYRNPILSGLVKAFNESFLVPRPAWALVLCLIIGVFIGAEAEFLNVLTQDDWSSFLYADEVWL